MSHHSPPKRPPAPAVLARQSHRPPARLDLGGPPGAEAALALSRLHECCGPARRSFAMLVATRLADLGDQSPIWWISPAWQADQLHADGVAQFVSPGRLMLLRPKRAEDVLWCLEEILRSGTAGLAVADIPGLPGLTAVRRLHLAAETGAGLGKLAPIGLILTPGPGGAQGVESRWHMASDHPSEGGEVPEFQSEFQRDKGHLDRAHGAPNRWRLERRRARMDPPRNWRVYLRPPQTQPQTSAPNDTFHSPPDGRMGFGLRPDGARDPAPLIADTAHIA